MPSRSLTTGFSSIFILTCGVGCGDTVNSSLQDSGLGKNTMPVPSSDGAIGDISCFDPDGVERPCLPPPPNARSVCIKGVCAFECEEGYLRRFDTQCVTPEHWEFSDGEGNPRGRYDVGAVWTGSEMIVWGGSECDDGRNINDASCVLTTTPLIFNPTEDTWREGRIPPSGVTTWPRVWTGSEVLVLGGRYDPVTDEWSGMNTDGLAPVSIGQMVWTGEVAVLWDDQRAQGAIYDPDDDRWTAITQVGAPFERLGVSAVWTGSEMIIWGGRAGLANLNSGRRYDPLTDVWRSMSSSSAPEARYWHSAVWTGSEMIIWGGHGDGIETLIGSGGRYNPVTDEWVWITAAGAPVARENHTMLWTGLEMLVWGGRFFDGDRICATSTGARYYPEMDTWIATGSIALSAGRSQHAGVWTGSEMIVWGGACLGEAYAPDRCPADSVPNTCLRGAMIRYTPPRE